MAAPAPGSAKQPPTDLENILQTAIRNGKVDEVRDLLSQWKQSMALDGLPADTLHPLLRLAVNAHQTAVAELLLEEGSPFSGETLSATLFLPNPPLEIYQLFLDRGWNINEMIKSVDMTLLMCVTDKPHILEWCLEHGSDPNVMESRGWTAMDWAAAESTAVVIRTLVQHGANASRSNALHAAAAKDPEEESDAAERNAIIACLLKEYGMDINARSTWEDGAPRGGKNVSGTPLHRAIQANNLSTASFLLQMGADREAVNVLGLSAVTYADKYGSTEMKRLLHS